MADSVDLLAGKIAELADKLTGPGVDAALGAARMDAYSCLAGGAMSLVVAAVLGLVARRLWTKRSDDDGGEFPFRHVAAVLLLIVAGFFLWSGAWAFIDPRTWTTIAHPEWWLAKRVLGL